MSRSITIAALILTAATTLILTAAPALAETGPCDQLPELRQGLKHFHGKPADRDRAKWQIETAEKLCKDGKEAEAKTYIDLAHGLVLKDHKH